MIARILNLVSWSNKNLGAATQAGAAGTKMNVVEPLEGRLFMSVAPAVAPAPDATAASASTIAADKAAIQAEITQIQADVLAVKNEIAGARRHFLSVTLPAAKAGVQSAEMKYEVDQIVFQPAQPLAESATSPITTVADPVLSTNAPGLIGRITDPIVIVHAPAGFGFPGGIDPAPPALLSADRAAIVTAKAQIKTDRAGLFSMIKLDFANGREAHVADESALKALEAKLKADSK